MELDENSRYITNFVTHCGSYRYKRLNCGVNAASEIFQNAIRQVTQNMNGVLNISDDILIFGKSKEEHDEALKAVLKRLNDNNLTINLNKCLFSQNKIKFFGHIFTSEGIYPDPDKIQSIINLSPPSNIHELRSFLGMLNYVGRFIPNLAHNTDALRKLLQKNKQFVWTEEQQNSFICLKSHLTNITRNTYYDQKRRTHLHVDASPIGLGAVLSQINEDNKIETVAYGSRTLTPVEQKYSQIERETLAATWAIQHFKLYLYGTKFILFTDHKPLVSILKNPRSCPSARIERLLLRIQPYEFIPVHQCGSKNPSDYLSRHPIQDSINSDYKIEDYVNFVLNKATPKMISLAEIQTATLQDNTLQILKQATLNNDQDLWKLPELKPYNKLKEELSIVNDVVLRSNRIIPPTTLQNKLIELAHIGHQGITKTLKLLRSKVWFPNMSQLVENFVKTCNICQFTTEYKQRDPIATYIKAERPFKYLSMDYAGPFRNGKYAVVIIDKYSKFPFVNFVPSTSFNHLKPILSNLFSLFGFPETIQSDNGPPFNGSEFTSFLNNFNIKHHCITPYWPEANGTAERFVKTLKIALTNILCESSSMEEKLNNFLMNYRSTTHDTTGHSPYSLLLNREVKGFLPNNQTTKSHTSENQSREEIVKRKRHERENQKRYIKPNIFEIGDTVLCKQKKNNALTPFYDSTPLKITNICGSQIEAKFDNGKTINRKSSFFKKINNPISTNGSSNSDSQDSDDDHFTDFSSEPVNDYAESTPSFVSSDIQHSRSNTPESELSTNSPHTVSPTNPSTATQQPDETSLRRSTRNRKRPSRLEDFI